MTSYNAQTDVYNFFFEKGYNINNQIVNDYLHGVAQYINDVRKYSDDKDYDVNDWYADTCMNYPEDIDVLEDPISYEKLQNAPDVSQWGYDKEDILKAIKYCENNDIDYMTMSPYEFEEIIIEANGILD